MKTEIQLKSKIREWIVLFIVFLVLSGITAFPIETELAFLTDHSSFLPETMKAWLNKIYEEVQSVNG